jgi:hypothetical protein
MKGLSMLGVARSLALTIGISAALWACVVSSAAASLGLQSVSGWVAESDGSVSDRAGGHPYEAGTRFGVDTLPPFFLSAKESIRDVIAQLPPGFVGNPGAVPRCTMEEFFDVRTNVVGCPNSSAIGVLKVEGGASATKAAVFNLVPPHGEVAAFGFNLANNSTVVIPKVRSGADYGVDVKVLDSNQEISITATEFVLWGNPSDPSHDDERGECVFGVSDNCPTGEVSSDAPPSAFLTNADRCEAGPLKTTLHVNSWQTPEFESASFDHDRNGEPLEVKDCDVVPFTPAFEVRPTSGAADSPTGLEVDLHIPTDGLMSPTGVGQARLKKTVVTLPEGMTVNPAAIRGRTVCTAAQIGLIGTDFSAPAPIHFTPEGDSCPDSSKIGTVSIETPLLGSRLEGSVYLAAQKDNPFESLLATYITVDDPKTGLVVKLAGRIDTDAATGRLTATFDNNPQLPFDDLEVDFFGGGGAPLINPPSCGTYSVAAELSPWTGTAPVSSSSSFQVTSGPEGQPCPNGQFAPRLSVGTTNPVGGAYSPFLLRLTREDGMQRLGALSVKLPQGLTAKLAGVPYCPEAALASVSGAEGAGAAQFAAPACAAASQIGTVTVGAGAGPNPLYVETGRAYLAGPYKGAPLSMAVIAPALAGPFDLGSVVVRNALYVDRSTAEITAVSDPLPTILHGVPLDLRDVLVKIDRSGFTLNPTSCDEMGFAGTASAPSGVTAPISDRFQVAGCGGLAFDPKLKLSLSGQMKRTGNPALKAVLTQKPGQANIDGVTVTLPTSQFIDNAHVNNPCTRVQFEADACPPKSILGTVTAYTPLLDQPLSGKVYFRSNGGERLLPDIVAALRGQISIDLVGYVDAVQNRKSKTSRVRNSFVIVPDAPVSKFVLNLKGGKVGLLENSENLCSRKQRARINIDAQNGKAYDTNPVIATRCGKNKPRR